MCQLGISVMSVLPFAHHDNMTPTPVVPLAAYVGSGSKAEKLDLSIRCPLYPRKRTSSDTSGMSALCQKRTHALQQKRRYSITSSARESMKHEGGLHDQ